MRPKVSVIIPTYNRAIKVRSAIDSVLAQTATGIEVIVVDDGSSDGTESHIASTYGSNIRYFYQRNQGASVARNRGIMEAGGEWIAFLDSDDVWESEKLTWQFTALGRFGPECRACYTDARFVNHCETRTMFQLAARECRHDPVMGINKDVMRRLVKPGGAGMVVCLSSLIVHADVVKKTMGFDPTLLYSQDSEFMFRLAMLTSFCYVSLPLVQFDRAPAEIRHTGLQSKWNDCEFWLQDSQLRLEKLLALRDGVPKKVRNVIRERLSAVYRGWTNLHLEAGNYAEARRSALKAVQLKVGVNAGAKWLLTWVSPKVARRTLRRTRSAKKSFTV